MTIVTYLLPEDARKEYTLLAEVNQNIYMYTTPLNEELTGVIARNL